jgi:putative heme degradation protein
MSGFLGVLDAPVVSTHLEKRPDPSQISARVASVVLKVEALAEIMATTRNDGDVTKSSI